MNLMKWSLVLRGSRAKLLTGKPLQQEHALGNFFRYMEDKAPTYHCELCEVASE